MNARQQYLLVLLDEIDAICRRNNIDYLLVGGSLIGALRSEGFLPWDDDADIAMTHANFQRFKEACATQLPPNRVLTAPELQEDCAVMIPRYTSTDTTLIHPAQQLHSCPAGEVVDIFILDPVADGPQAQRTYEEKLCMLHEMCNYASTAANRYSVPYEAYEHYAAVKQERGKLAVCQQLEQEIQGLFSADGSRYLYRWQGGVESYPRAWFDTTVELRFEGRSFMAPAGFNSYLTQYFGEEWSELPGRISATKHDAAASLAFPASEALERYRPAFERSELRQRVWEGKGRQLELAEDVNRLKDDVARTRAVCAALELQRHLQQVGPQFKAAHAAKDGRALSGLLADYLAVQTSKELIGRRNYTNIYRFRNPVLAPVPDEAFEAALWALMETERMHMAQRLISIREQQGRPLSAAMTEVKQALKMFRGSVECLERGELDEGLLTASLAAKRHPHVSAFLKLTCVFLQRMGARGRQQLERALTAARERYPWDGFFTKLEADLLWEQGNRAQAERRYLMAAEATRNGFALLDIRKRTGYWPRWMREAAWGVDYGIPAWEGPEPEALPQRPGVPAPDSALSPQRYLYQLLKQVAGLCDELGICYYLAPAAQAALMGWGVLPAAVGDYALVLGAAGAQKLRAALEAGALPARRVESAPQESAAAFCVCGEDSLLLEMGALQPSSLNGLYVSVLLERSEHKSSGLLGTLKGVLTRQATRYGGLAAEPLPCADGVSGFEFKVRTQKVRRGKRPPARLVLDRNTVLSTVISMADAEAVSAVPAGYWERSSAVRPAFESAVAAHRESRAAFRQLKLAVKLKELALELLPRKAELLELERSGNTEQLRQELRPYLRIARHADSSVELCFDEELYALLKRLEA